MQIGEITVKVINRSFMLSDCQWKGFFVLNHVKLKDLSKFYFEENNYKNFQTFAVKVNEKLGLNRKQ